jgi:hypothetical protein
VLKLDFVWSFISRCGFCLSSEILIKLFSCLWDTFFVYFSFGVLWIRKDFFLSGSFYFLFIFFLSVPSKRVILLATRNQQNGAVVITVNIDFLFVQNYVHYMGGQPHPYFAPPGTAYQPGTVVQPGVAWQPLNPIPKQQPLRPS